MNHEHELPPLPHAGHKKAVPPGSLLYEQVLDDLRNALPSSPVCALSSSSARPLSAADANGVTVHVQLCDNPLHDYVDGWEFQAQEGGQVNGDWFTPCRVCSGPEGGSQTAARGVAGREEEVVRRRGWADGGESCGSCVHVCDFLADLKLQDVEASSGEMGHSPSLLNHKHHKRDYIARDDTPSPRPRHPHSRDPPKRQAARYSRSPTLPSAASQGHVISRSASLGVQDDAKFFTDDEDPDGRAGSSPGEARGSQSRVHLRVSSATQRQCSPSPNRTGSGPRRGRPQFSPPRNGRARHGEKGDEAFGGSQRRESGKTSTPSPKRRLFPDVHQTRSKSPASMGLRLSPSAAMCQRRGSYEIPRDRHETWGSTSPSYPSPSHSPAPLSSSPSSKEHIHLCKSRVDDLPADDVSAPGNQFPEINRFFRLRSQSDVSMHVQRDGRLPRLPLLRQRSGASEEEEGEESQVRVHWADECRPGCPLATSVLLSSIRPRALSHGSADLPRKPILKKPLGF